MSDSVRRALAVATDYVKGYYDAFPEMAAGSGYPDAPQDRLGDYSAPALARWREREDAWLAEVRAIPPKEVEGTEAHAPLAVVRERLEAEVEARVLAADLWNCSPAWGWLAALPIVFTHQRVGSLPARTSALARARDVSRYLDADVQNLREGLRCGFTAARVSVEPVLEQVEELLGSETRDSPFLDPARRDPDPAFRDALAAVVEVEIHEALTRYRDFLAADYLPHARSSVGVTSLPCGAAGYPAAVRLHASVSPPPEEIHAVGLQEMDRIHGEMREIAVRSFGTDDVPALLQRLRSDTAYTFASEDDVLKYTRDAVERAQGVVPHWFGRVPRSPVVVRPFPAFQKRTGGGLYSAPAEDGGHPGTYEMGTHRPETLSRTTAEATAFHETWPGHHLQIALGVEAPNLHPSVRYLFCSGFIEGWALYSERLADEMRLYSSDLDRLGMLSNEAMRATRLVVDPGLHVMGWTREKAIRYMLAHTAESEAAATYEVDRYIAGPGQAVSYLLGCLEISRLRRLAESELGERFDIRVFHDRLLEDGSVTLPVTRDKIERWLRSGGG